MRFPIGFGASALEVEVCKLGGLWAADGSGLGLRIEDFRRRVLQCIKPRCWTLVPVKLPVSRCLCRTQGKLPWGLRLTPTQAARTRMGSPNSRSGCLADTQVCFHHYLASDPIAK